MDQCPLWPVCVKHHVDFGTCHVIAPCVPIKRYTSCVLCSVPIKRCTVHCFLCEVCAHQSQQQGDNSPCLSTAPLFVRKSYSKDGLAIMYMHFNLQKPYDHDSLIIFLKNESCLFLVAQGPVWSHHPIIMGEPPPSSPLSSSSTQPITICLVSRHQQHLTGAPHNLSSILFL